MSVIRSIKKRVEKRGLSLFIKNKKEYWPAFGKEHRFEIVYYKKFKKLPIEFLKKSKNKKPKVMILGAGLGEDIKLLKAELQKNNVNPSVDVFSLTKSISKTAKKEIKKDYSINKALETINFKEHSKLINNIKEKYDLVVAPLSVGVYTDHVAYNLFITSKLLNKNGKAYVEVLKDKKLIEKFNRFNELFNKQFKETAEFNINQINENEKYFYFEITRKK